MESKGVVNLTNLYFLSWDKSRSTIKIALSFIEQDSRDLEVHADSYLYLETQAEYEVFNAAKLNNKYIELLDSYNIADLDINDYRRIVTEFVDCTWGASTSIHFPQILEEPLHHLLKFADFEIYEDLSKDELSLRKNVIYNHTIHENHKTIHLWKK